jgi:hypothetical protein
MWPIVCRGVGLAHEAVAEHADADLVHGRSLFLIEFSLTASDPEEP